MRRLRELLNGVAFEHVRYLPSIVRAFKDWRRFLLDYAFLQSRGALYSLRNGLRVLTSGSQDAATLAVVFAKREYGAVPEDAVLVDLGANIGAFSLYAAASTQRSVVYAYEPEPRNFALLKRNIALNGMEGRISPVQSAVTGQVERRRLYLSRSPLHSLYPGARGQESIEVPCIGMAELFERHELDTIDFLKIDCEGAEFEILYGTPAHRLRNIGAIRMEVNVANLPGRSFGELQRFLATHGFELEAGPTKAAVAWFRRLKRREGKPEHGGGIRVGPAGISSETRGLGTEAGSRGPLPGRFNA